MIPLILFGDGDIMKKMNVIFLRRKKKLVLGVGHGSGDVTNEILGTLLKNIEQIGYTLSGEVLEQLKTFNMAEVGQFYTEFPNTSSLWNHHHRKSA